MPSNGVDPGDLAADVSSPPDLGRRFSDNPENQPVHRFAGKWANTLNATWSALVPQEFQSVTKFAKYLPLMAAIIAPTSTLLDIPALSQPWYSFQGHNIHDPVGCIILSAIGLALNVTANCLLLMRFSGTRRVWRKGTSLSLIFWIAKTAVAIVNVSYYGASRRNAPGFTYTEGFWCAVASVIMAGLISIALLFHYIFAFGKLDAEDGEDLRLTGRKFMFSVTFFMFLLGLQGLAFNQLEHWAYLDAIYFSLQCALTVGYGDLVATTSAGKVLVFIFSVLTISQLANEVSIIIDFVHSRSQQKRDEWRKKYSVAMHKQAIKQRPYATLIDEMSLIHQINLHQETKVQFFDLFWSGLSLATFWLVGAVIFSSVEGWTYGNALYAVMVLSLTIGFGDFTPHTPAGRVIWVVYALMAVPIVTNFAVQTVGGIMYTWSEHRFTRARFEMERERDPEAFAPHSHYILRHHEEWDDVREKFIETREKAALEFKSFAKIVPAKTHESPGATPESPAGSIATSVNATNSPASSTRRASAFRGRSLRRSQTSPSMNSSDAASDKSPASTFGRFTRRNNPLRPFAKKRTSTQITEAQAQVISQMLDDPSTHADVVDALGCPDVQDVSNDGGTGVVDDPEAEGLVEEADDFASGEGGEGSTSTTTRVDDSERSKMAKNKDADSVHAASVHGLATPTGTCTGAGTDSCGGYKGTRIGKQRSRMYTMNGDPSSIGTTPTTPTKGGDQFPRTATRVSHAAVGPRRQNSRIGAPEENSPAMGPRLMRTTANGEELDDVQLTGDPMVDSHRLELYLIKELVDRVTRLEAQSRQMLIDCMDKDVARTLLLADRNLQIRDAFQLYGNKIDVGKAYKEEAEQTRQDSEKIKEERAKGLHEQAAIIDSYSYADEDMLSRVRRYRSTFAEVLVLSSTLLKLEGDDLKRFERWHVGGLYHDHHVTLAEGAAGAKKHQRKRDRAKRGLGRLADFVSARREPERRRSASDAAEKAEHHGAAKFRQAFARHASHASHRHGSHAGAEGAGDGGGKDPAPTDKTGGRAGPTPPVTATAAGSDPNADPPPRPKPPKLAIKTATPVTSPAVGCSLLPPDPQGHILSPGNSLCASPASYTSSLPDGPPSPRSSSPTASLSPVTTSYLSPASAASASPTASPKSPKGSKHEYRHEPKHTAMHRSATLPAQSDGSPKRRHTIKERMWEHHANRLIADTAEEAHYFSGRFVKSVAHKLGRDKAPEGSGAQGAAGSNTGPGTGSVRRRGSKGRLHPGQLGYSTADELAAAHEELSHLADRQMPRTRTWSTAKSVNDVNEARRQVQVEQAGAEFDKREQKWSQMRKERLEEEERRAQERVDDIEKRSKGRPAPLDHRPSLDERHEDERQSSADEEGLKGARTPSTSRAASP